MAFEAMTKLARLSTGIEGLDTILNGGLLRGAAYILQGRPGAGKTILANQFCFHQAAQGRKALYMTLLAESHDRMLAHMSAMRFFDPARIPDSLYYMSAFPVLKDEGLEGLLRLIGREVRRHRADALVLDGLFVVHESAAGEQEFRHFVHELQGQAAMTGCTLLLLTNQSRSPSAPEHTMVDGWLELIDEIHGARSVRSLVVQKQRGGSYLRGRHQFRITDRGIVVFPRAEALLTREPAPTAPTERLSTGIDGFDRMIDGGYPSGSATILLGPSGTGKTTMGLQFLSSCTPEAPGLLFGFYETPARLRAKARSIGIDLDGLVERGAVEIVWQSPAENLPDELAYRLLSAIERRKARRVFYDGIGALAHAFIFPERLPIYLGAINNTLRSLDATIVYTMEMPDLFMPDNLHTSNLSSIVDNVVLLHYTKYEALMRRTLSILKIRDSEFDAFPEEYYISARGVRFGKDSGRGHRPKGAGAKRRPSSTKPSRRSQRSSQTRR